MVYQAQIWQGQSGKWYCNDTRYIGRGSGEWYVPARILGVSPAEFIQFLLNNFHPDYCYYDEKRNFFSYSWAEENKTLCNSFKLYINRKAKEKNFQV